ncbi:MAG: hypothetical protein JWO08_1805, partial [Verrucomicrobiaceae bacterium]|nr:hypothetical protein [Verrucomicrobiaceae bacterium]
MSVAAGAAYPPAISSPIRPCGPTPRGQVAHFSVYVSGKAPFTYAWKFNNTVFFTKASSLTYDTIDVTADYSAEGNYSVTVTNADGTVSSGPVAFDVIPGPPVVTHSLPVMEIIAVPGDVVDMRMYVSGYKPMTFQWKKDGRNFGAAFTNSTGEASLKLPRVPASNGNYSCTVTNADGSLTTPAAHVGFWATPAVRLLNTLVLTQYNYFSIEPTVISTEDAVSYQWQFNGVNIPGATDWRLDRSAANVLNLGGSYRVIMRTAHHTCVSNSATVVAVINTVPGVVRAQGSTVVLKVPGSRPGPSYLWRRNDDKPLSAHCSGINTPILTITKADMDMDSAGYHCLVYVTNGSSEAVIGGYTSVAIVKEKPQFVGLTGSSSGEVLVPSTGEMLMKWEFQLEATNQPTIFAAIGLPPGIVVDSKTGFVSGAPVKAGDYHVTFSASNPIGTTTSPPFLLTISPSEDKHLSGTWVGPIVAYIYGDIPSVCSCSVTVTSLGVFTGKVWGLFGGTTVRSYPFSGAIGGNLEGSFDGSSAFFAMPKSSLPPCSGTVSMYLRWSEGQLTGQLVDKDP